MIPASCPPRPSHPAPLAGLPLRVALMLALTGALMVAAASPARAAFSPEQLAAMQQAVETEMRVSGYPGIVASFSLPGKGWFQSASGIADVPTGRPMRLDDAFRIGSVTKTFIATVVLQLVQRHQLSLDDHVDEYIDGIPGGDQITIRQLLNHTSGVPDTPDDVAVTVFEVPQRRWTPMEVIRRAIRLPPTCAPGTCWSYSNTNYQLLGVIARRVTGRSIRHLLRTSVLRRLDLARTSFRPGAHVPRPRAQGYDRETADGPMVDVTRLNYSWSWTAGSMVSTLADMERWAPALATGRRLLSPATQRERLSFVATGTAGIGYGLGIMQVGPFLGHDGAVPGYDSLVLYAPSTRAKLVLLANTAVELDVTKNSATPTLFTLASCLVAISEGQSCSWPAPA